MTRKHVVIGIAAAALGLGAGSSVAFADDGQPSEGINSTDQGSTGGRNEAGYGGGPHCHLLENPHFDHLLVYPSHTGHANSSGPISADGDCDGQP